MPIPQAALRAYRHLRRLANEIRGRDVRTPVVERCARLLLGSEYGEWCVAPDLISASSIVYSAGVGEDITFDLALIRRFGLLVHAFDPTPKSMRWIGSQDLPPQFVFSPVGLSGRDGVALFDPPSGDGVSYTISGGSKRAQQSIEAPVRRVRTLMHERGHSHIDVLKLDIEGAEYEVIDDLSASPISIGQLLIEFHYTDGVRSELAKVERALGQLANLGFRLFYRSPTGREMSMLGPRAMGLGAG
jgi:FkbM family methyltransferase